MCQVNSTGVAGLAHREREIREARTKGMAGRREEERWGVREEVNVREEGDAVAFRVE